LVRRARYWVILWFGIALLAGVGLAERYRFRQFGPEDGLNTSVSRVLHDRPRHARRQRTLRAGMDDYISKPIDLQALARMIDRYRVSRPAPAAID